MQKIVKKLQDHGRKFMCDLCRLEYENKQTLKNHKMQDHDHDRKFKCELCGLEYDTDSYMKYHMKRVHKDSQKTMFWATGWHGRDARYLTSN